MPGDAPHASQEAANLELLKTMPFAVTVGITLEVASADQVVAQMPWTAERSTAGGALHGGAVMTLADSAGAVCAYLNLPEGAGTSTVSSSTSFLRAVRGGQVQAVARPLHVGRSFVVVVVELTDDQGRLVAQVTQTQAVLVAAKGRS